MRLVRCLVIALLMVTSIWLSGCRAKLEITCEEFIKKAETVRRTIWDQDAFVAEIGCEPYKSIKLGEKYYWYYYCSNGKVIIMVKAEPLDNDGKVEVLPGIRQLD